jgi:hypothetical protein
MSDAAVWCRLSFIQLRIQDSKVVETAKKSEPLRLLGTHEFLHSTPKNLDSQT